MASGRKPTGRAGKRKSIYLPPDCWKIARQIDNFSEFVQLATRQASAIMAFDIVREHRGLPQPKAPTADQVKKFNELHPLDPLTAKRLGKTQNGPAPQALTGNPALDN